ncbi:MAG: hypothetical protein ACFFFB_15220 [Candidatus Heimdallarchaeota archaeon]
MASNSLSQESKEIIDVDEFLDKYQYISNLDLKHILNLDFELDYYYKSEKVCPIIELAKPEDAKEIVSIFNEIYRGNYPYKQMEDIDSIRRMITHSNYYWFVFKLKSKEIVGCFGADLDLNEKRAFLHGFNIKKQYQKTTDIFKAFIGCIIYLWREYRDKIFLWYGEMRTNEAISQFFTSLIGMKPVAFLPNKDIFFNKIESDVLHIIFNKAVLKQYRFKEKPKIIRQVLNCYSYTNKRYDLDLPHIENPKINLNRKEIELIKSSVSTEIKEDTFGNQEVKFFLKKNSSFFEFFYNIYSKNIENTKYTVHSLEELFVFIEKVKIFIDSMNINYFECYVSAYFPEHQKLFNDAGFKPRGYVPCWKFHESENYFEDQIIFNSFNGSIDENIKLIPEAIDLIQTLNLSKDKQIQDSLKINIF